MPRFARPTAPLALALLALGAASPLAAAGPSPKEIVERHTASGGDIDRIMADYADDAVVLQDGRAIQGKAAIRQLFERMFAPPTAGAPPPRSPEGSAGGMHVTRVWEEGDVGFMTWERGPVQATEEFLVRDGKIEVQTIFMSGAPRRAPAPAPRG